MRITLAESTARHGRPSPWVAGSLAAHAAAASLVLLRGAATPSLPVYVPEVLPPYVEITQQPAPPSSSRGATSFAGPGTAAPPAVSIPVLEFPVIVPPAMPSVPGPNSGFDPGSFERRAFGSPAAPIASLPSGGDIFDVRSVDRPVRPLAGNPAPRYPAPLAQAGVQGVVTMRFVVDTTGRVEPGSIRVARGAHLLFERAVREILPHLRFLPADVAGVKVRQIVEQPFLFELARRHEEEDRSR
jgi:protein TonB